MLKPPLTVTPEDGITMVDPVPQLSWQVPDGFPGETYDFVVEIAEDPDFSRNVRRFSSFDSKVGFSFNQPVEQGTGQIISFKPLEPLVKF
jgi:hypothetical protein